MREGYDTSVYVPRATKGDSVAYNAMRTGYDDAIHEQATWGTWHIHPYIHIRDVLVVVRGRLIDRYTAEQTDAE